MQHSLEGEFLTAVHGVHCDVQADDDELDADEEEQHFADLDVETAGE